MHNNECHTVPQKFLVKGGGESDFQTLEVWIIVILVSLTLFFRIFMLKMQMRLSNSKSQNQSLMN